MECVNCTKELSGKQKRFCSVECKDTVSNKEYYKKNWDKIAIQRKEKYWNNVDSERKKSMDRYRENPEKYRVARIKYAKEHPETDKAYKQSLKGRYMTYKRGAKKRGYEMEITLGDFERMWDTDCVYCGDKVNGIGIDRVDNSKGYTVDNIVSCCTMCNRMKLASTREDFINQCKKIATIWH